MYDPHYKAILSPRQYGADWLNRELCCLLALLYCLFEFPGRLTQLSCLLLLLFAPLPNVGNVIRREARNWGYQIW